MKFQNIKKTLFTCSAIALLSVSTSFSAEDVLIEGNNSNGEILNVVDLNGQNTNKIAILGASSGNTGIGIQGIGRTGVDGNSVVGGVSGTTNKGVHGNASGATYNWGVVGEASGTYPYAGVFWGDIYIQGIIDGPNFSDRKFKKNIRSMKGNLAKIMKLKPKNYHWKKEEFPNRKFTDTEQIGLIAQELEEVFPLLVRTSILPIPENSDEQPVESKSIDYSRLVVVLIGAIQEQQEQINKLKNQISNL